MRRINYFSDDLPRSRSSDLKEVPLCSFCDDGRDYSQCYLRRKGYFRCPFVSVFENEV